MMENCLFNDPRPLLRPISNKDKIKGRIAHAQKQAVRKSLIYLGVAGLAAEPAPPFVAAKLRKRASLLSGPRLTIHSRARIVNGVRQQANVCDVVQDRAERAILPDLCVTIERVKCFSFDTTQNGIRHHVNQKEEKRCAKAKNQVVHQVVRLNLYGATLQLCRHLANQLIKITGRLRDKAYYGCALGFAGKIRE